MAAQFSDDAYNKELRPGEGPGTLIGNWCEERVLRESSGEGRTVPQRHLQRSGLLKDWTKVPTIAMKKDDTFDRVYGPKAPYVTETASKTIGKHDESVPNLMRSGPLAKTLERARHESAEAEVQGEEAIRAEMESRRHFETTTGVTHSKPDHTLAVKAVGKKSCKLEITRGPAPDPCMAMGNDGIEVPTHSHYANVEQVTHQRMCLADTELRSNVRVSASAGIGPFHRNSEFTKPLGEFYKGLLKDDEMENMFNSLKESQPLRHLEGSRPVATTFSSVPSLAALKEAIHNKIAEVWGPHGYIILRHRLFDFSDHEGFVQKGDVVSVMREQLGVDTDGVAEKPLDVWLTQLVTMKKDELRVGSLLTSLRPSLPQKDKRKVLEMFKSLQSASGTVRLGDWLARLGDNNVKQTVVAAFGAEDEASVADTGVTEQVFLELFSDLAPLSNIDPLLV
mmetsp:Transcript_70604/g.113814  ORF Transcript_70604/g.113814 Transcript_70604/m.113814 type:complete len:451 (-) Transcript_70604:96-1448(-)